MASSAKAKLLDQMRTRLESAAELALEMRRALRVSDAGSIESATGRLETVVLECKLLQEEFHRLPTVGADTVELLRASVDLEATAVQLARSSAISSGILERLVMMSRGLIDAVNPPVGESYLRSGESRRDAFGGLWLKETV